MTAGIVGAMASGVLQPGWYWVDLDPQKRHQWETWLRAVNGDRRRVTVELTEQMPEGWEWVRFRVDTDTIWPDREMQFRPNTATSTTTRADTVKRPPPPTGVLDGFKGTAFVPQVGKLLIVGAALAAVLFMSRGR